MVLYLLEERTWIKWRWG